MEIKRNEATLNRPAGDRIIDAPVIAIDIPQFVAQLRNEKAWEKNEKNGITVFKSSELALVLVALHKNAELIENRVDGYLIVQVLSGHIEVKMTDRHIELQDQQVLVLHPGIDHKITAKGDTILLLTNSNK